MITKLIEFVSKHQKYFTIGGACILLVLNTQQRNQIKELKQQQFIQGGDIQKAEVIDSLQTELFNVQSINGRYELSLQHLYEVNPSAAKEFDDYLNHETE
jgi:hypothetical protein